MAEIIKKTEQLDALKDIQEALDAIGRVNTMLLNREGYTILAAGRNDAPRHRVGVEMDDKSIVKIDALLKAQRERTVRMVRQKAEKYEIAMDDNDELILSGEPPVVKSRSRKEESPTPENPAEEDNTMPSGDEYPSQESYPG